MDALAKEQRERDHQLLVEEAADIGMVVADAAWLQFNERQLWYIFLSLDQPDLVEPLRGAQQNLANQAKAYGNHHYRWDEK